RVWVDEILQQRRFHGFYEYIFPILQTREARFNDYFRMTATQFAELRCIVGPSIYKQTHIREPMKEVYYLSFNFYIYLASGDLVSSIQYHYLRGLTTVNDIIRETCGAIWNCLHSLVLPATLTTENWLSKEKDFEELWNFTHSIGAIDGKHIVLQCPDNAGSSFYNYKGCHSIVLLAICDANYKFTYVDIGSFGRGSDSTVFKNSSFGQKFIGHEMNLPNPSPISIEGPNILYFLVGDEAFALTEYMLRPYPGRNLTPEIYNYRLSRARRAIENTFGILASQWKIFRRPIDSTRETATKIVQAAVCLHNFLRRDDTDTEYITPDMLDRNSDGACIPGSWRTLTDQWSFQDITRAGTNTNDTDTEYITPDMLDRNSDGARIPGSWRILTDQWSFQDITTAGINTTAVCLHNFLRRDDTDTEYITPDMLDRNSDGACIPGSWRTLTDQWSFQDITRAGTNTSSRSAIAIRDEFCAYFNGEGAVPWQYDNCN
ncbi:hypothetical protein TSAR_013450, partial [Trichomalopsis sarcophagae]